MAWSPLYATGSPYWRFAYTIDEEVQPLEEGDPSYIFIVRFYLYRPDSSSWYQGPDWTFWANVAGTYQQVRYNPTAKYTIPAKQYIEITSLRIKVNNLSYNYMSRNITVSAGFEQNKGRVSPYRSDGGTITFQITRNAGNVQRPTVTLLDRGNNYANIQFTSRGGINNAVQSTWCEYKFDNGSTKQLNASSDIAIPKGATKLDIVKIASQGVLGDVVYGTVSSTDVSYYENPNPPTNLQIIPNHATNKVTITATQGTGTTPTNPSKGVNIFYTTDGKTKPSPTSTRYTEPFSISKDTIVKAAARTEGTYTGNNNSYKYSDFVYASSAISKYSPPGYPDLEIIDKGDNTFSIKCKVGQDGDNNSATGVEIYYTLDNTDPSTNASSSKKIILMASAGLTVQSDNIPIDVRYVDADYKLTVKAVAYTKGSVTLGNNEHLYSQEVSASQQIIYYRPALLNVPTITYDRKLTKRSTITTKQYATCYKHTQVKKCTVELYKAYTLLESQDIDAEQLNQINQKWDEEDRSQEVSCNFELYKYDNVKKDDEIYVRWIYTLQYGQNEENQKVERQVVSPSSDIHLVESSGVMRVNVGNVWYDGQVWVNVNGVWKEATDVYVNINGSWKESV